MTVIQPNSISGITSITAQGDTINIYKSDGTTVGALNVNVNASSGVTTIANLSGTNINVTGVATFVSSRPVNLSVSGVTTTSSIIVGTAVTINSTGINAPGIGITIANVNGGQLGGSRNMVINGSMVVNQRGFTGAAGTTTNESYTTDRFVLAHSHDGAVSAGQTTMNSTVGGNAYVDGFNTAHILRVTTADSSLAAGQFQLIQQRMEGYNVQGIKKGTVSAQSVTLSFWVRSTTTGTYICELFDQDNSRQVAQAYTINAANTWEKKSLTFPADATGVLDNDNARSLDVNWWLAAGSTYSGGTLNTSWAAVNNANRAVGQVNALAAVGDFYLTGVQLEVGPTATEFERRSFGQELALCQRYYYRVNATSIYTAYGHGWNNSTSGGQVVVRHPVRMRSAPTSLDYLSLSSTVLGVSEALVATAGLDSNSNGTDATTIQITSSGLFTTGFMTLTAKQTTSSYIGFSAEL